MVPTGRPRRQAFVIASSSISAQADDVDVLEPRAAKTRLTISSRKRSSPDSGQRADFASREYVSLEQEETKSSDSEENPPKRRRQSRVSKNLSAGSLSSLFALDQDVVGDEKTPGFPARIHDLSYHRPLLLSRNHGYKSRTSLLAWFGSVSAARQMPWRKPWIDPQRDGDTSGLRALLERRAYEVWISEIMLQQTRVAVVIDYWNRWMQRWPTIQDLAAAKREDVVSAWRGLGYYSRATRIHEASQLVVADSEMKGLLSSDTAVLQSKVPGVGRYTAGAIVSIVFGKPAPMVDGNVLRVLSRQLGIHGDVKTDKAVVSLLWEAADALVKAAAADVSRDKESNGTTPTNYAVKESVSDVPGRWGQALMELGSTVCTPRPNCGACPITTTCRAFAEGQSLLGTVSTSRFFGTANTAGYPPDIEDACTLCQELELAEPERKIQEDPEGSDTPNSRKSKPRLKGTVTGRPDITKVDMEKIVDHARRFPFKVAKRAIREETSLVCAIRRADGLFLLSRRPEKGLLAGLWELPSKIMPQKTVTPASRKSLAKEHVLDVLPTGMKSSDICHVGEIGTVPWTFSHLKLTMHIHLFDILDQVSNKKLDGITSAKVRWVDDDGIDRESMGTGMRKCWAVVKDSR